MESVWSQTEAHSIWLRCCNVFEMLLVLMGRQTDKTDSTDKIDKTDRY